MTRVGWGVDAHRFGEGRSLILCGVVVDQSRGLAGTSDADVALHAVIDAMLGAAALGDIGDLFPSSDPRWEGAASAELLDATRLFPSSDPRWEGAASAELLDATRRLIAEAGFVVTGVDVTIVAESVHIAPHRPAMRSRLASLLDLDVSRVSLKATSTDGLGFLGRDEGVAAMAVAALSEPGAQP